MNWRDRIIFDASVCNGQPCFKGTRIIVAVVLDNLAAGVPAEEVLKSYPTLSPEHIVAAFAYAAELLREGRYFA